VSLFAHSSLIAAKVQHLHALVGEFPAYPRVLRELCATGWLACGSAAMAFDPLCGEGAGNAAREAILACAAARAIQEGESAEAVLSEYDARLKLGFLRHLENCREFYSGDFQTEFWRDARHGIEQGLGWTRDQLAARYSPKFRLVDFALRRIAM
jgi:flavin-dependent dehydrogenase